MEVTSNPSDAPATDGVGGARFAWVAQLEALLGLGMAGLLAVLAISAGPIYRFRSDRHPMSIVELLFYLAIGLPLAIPELMSVALIARAISKLPQPKAWKIATLQPRFARGLRPIVSVWWLANFIACVWIAEAWTNQLFLLKPSFEERALTLTLQFGLLFGASFAGNLFLLLAAEAVFQEGRVFQLIRRCRFLIDGVMVGALIAWGNV
jgi:hypothetical protein